MLKLRRLTPIFVAALSLPLGAQVFDNTGNNLLNGTYYFREVIYNLNTQLYAVVYGNISFTGNGSYSIFDAMEADTSSGQLTSYAVSGTYTISASGYGFLSNQLLGSPTYGMVSNGIFVGSTTESGYNDVFIAAPVNGQNTGTLQGSYTMAYMHPLIPADAVVQLTANGGGNIGNVSVGYYQTASTPTNQSISGVKYFVSNNAFVVTYPTNSNNLISGTEYLYSTPDGSFVFGGNPEDFDMVVGVRNGSAGNNFGGLYYAAGIDEDTSELAEDEVGLDTYYGSFNASNGVVIGHERIQANNTSAYGYTFDDSYPTGTNGTYNDAFTSAQYFGGNGGAIRIGVGIGPSLSLSVAVQAPTFGGSGVYLNPAGVVNAASNAPFTAGLSPGEFITLYGTNLGPSTLQFASTVPFPTKLGGVQVLINNSPVPLYYVSANQISAIVPFEITSAVAQIQVTYNGATSNAVTELVNLTTPGVFTNDPVGGIGYSAALHPDYSLVTPESPAQVGETIAVYMTGLGTVFPSVADGAAATGTTTTSNAITADINGVTATVTYAGLAPGFVGLYQVNVQIPSGVSSGDNYLDIGGPDSYASEALISIGDTGLSAQARPTRPDVLRRRSASLHPLQRKTLLGVK
jgi:uncharacterized protein (TIGR03437 family)